MALDLAIAALAFGYGVYMFVWTNTLPYPWLMGFLFVGDFYFRLWRRPIRQARFFEDHFEILGLGVDTKNDYSFIEDVSKYRQLVGDFGSDSRVSFTVRGNPALFVLPNRRDRKGRRDLYTFLLQKSKQ